MHKLTPLELSDEFATWQGIASGKHPACHQRLKQLAAEVRKRYDQYVENCQELAELPPCGLSHQEREDCASCYDGVTAALGRLKGRIESVQVRAVQGRCGYCHYEADSFDHYAPKALFPEFSVLARNLVPSCSACNRHKGRRWTKSGKREILNLYYDPMPTKQLIKAVVEVNASKAIVVRFELIPQGALPDPCASLYASTVERLKLATRFAKRSNAAVAEAKTEIGRSAVGGKKGARKLLLQQAKRKAKIFGKNNWNAVLLFGLADSDSFLELALGNRPPRSPRRKKPGFGVTSDGRNQ